MHHFSKPEHARTFFETIVGQMRRPTRIKGDPMTFGLLAGLVALGQVKAQKGGPKDIVMIMNAVAAFTDLDDESDEITITRTYRRHSDATLARMMWRELLKNACAQNPASS